MIRAMRPSAAAMAPTLHAEGLILRPHLASDFDAYARWMGAPGAVLMGGPFDRNAAWSWFASDVAQWPLFGWGGLAVTDRDSGDLLGQVSIIRPPSYPEAEIGWIADPAAEGRGVIARAARAMLDWAFGLRGLSTLVSYIHPENGRSIRLAERLGAVRDAAARPAEPGDLVYRHHPAGGVA